ncbi:MAG: hypothetical protein RIQ41_13 [Candidatus Parcubacteria bacterium]
MQLVIDIALSLIYFCIFLLVCAWAWRFWKMYITQKHFSGLDWVMLEIKLPREIFKSPYATEVAISSLLQTGGVGTWYAREIKGAMPVFASLEIASTEGIIHFYVRIQRKFRPLVESNFYAQYPGIEITEAQDYTSVLQYHHLTKDVAMWGESYKLDASWEPWNWEKGERYVDPKDSSKKYSMKADFLPIKTYVDYGLDKDPKEEFKIEPLAPLLETMGSLGKGEHLWYQVLLQSEALYNGTKMPKMYHNEVTHEAMSLSKMVEEFKKSIRVEGFTPAGQMITEKIDIDENGNPVPKKVLNEEPIVKTKKEMDLSTDDKDKLESINKKLAKPIASAIIRLMYVVDKNKASFNPALIQNILAFPKPFEGRFNKLTMGKTSDPYEYPWENFRNRRVPWRSEEFFEAYVEREGFFPHIEGRDSLDKLEDTFFWGFSMKTRKTWRMLFEAIMFPFHHPHADEITALNMEEVATIWHLPGAIITTPTLPRIDSAKAVAPVNLPQ